MTLATHDDIRNFIPPADCLKVKIFLVTGAGDGIGKAAALSYAKYGATVLLLRQNREQAWSVCVYDPIGEGGAACHVTDEFRERKLHRNAAIGDFDWAWSRAFGRCFTQCRVARCIDPTWDVWPDYFWASDESQF